MSCEHEIKLIVAPTDDACRFHVDVRAYKDRIVAPDEYSGATEVTPSHVEQVLPTTDKLVRDDITVNPAPTEYLSTDHNGTFTPSDGKVGFSQVDVDVQPDLRPLSVSENGSYQPDGFDGYKMVTVSTYTAEDEGKVLHNGNFVTQVSESVTVEDNTTVDTTLINSLSVDVTNPLQRANLANADDAVEGYLNDSGVLLQDTINKPITTGYIDVSGSIDGKIYIITAMNKSMQIYTIWGYDENKQRIGSQKSYSHTSTTSIGYIEELAIPSGAKYVRLSFNTAGETVFAVLLTNPLQVLGETLGWTKFKYTT